MEGKRGDPNGEHVRGHVDAEARHRKCGTEIFLASRWCAEVRPPDGAPAAPATSRHRVR
jgi:hypothetical protein